jgi:hypothetical protein
VSRITHRVPALILAGILALALPGAALGVSASSAETLTVQSQTTLTGVPASIAYGSGLGGTTLSASALSIGISTNAATGYTFSVSATNLTSSAGSIQSTNRLFLVSATCDAAGCTVGSKWKTAPGGSYTGPAGTAETISTSASNNSTAHSYSVTPKVAIPSGALAGDYTGTLTFAAVANP